MCRCCKGPICYYIGFKILLALTINATYLILGVLLYVSETSRFGGTIQAETEQWALGAILDLQTTSSSSCPSGYDL